jgi:putative oxidoreductase
MIESSVPTSSTGVRIFAHGGPEVLTFGDYPLPAIGPRDVLVKVAAASVSGWDLKYREGLHPGSRLPGRTAFPLPQQLGREVAGTVVATGEAVHRFQPGDRVVGVVHPENPRSPETIRGLGNLSTGVDVPGHQSMGGYASHVVRDEDLWLAVPDGVDLEQAAITLWPYATSLRLLVDRLGVRVADTVLVHGASGGMGQATIQLAGSIGAVVIATTRHQAKADVLRELGVDEVVVTDDLTEAEKRIRAATTGEGVDHVVDYSGSRELMRLSLRTLRLGGRICPAAGDQDPQPIPVTVADLTRLEMTLVGIRGARHRDALTVLDLLSRKRIHPRVAARFPLSQAAAAHALLENSTDLVGRIVLIPDV